MVNSNARKSVKILRVRIDSTSTSIVLRKVQSKLEKNDKFLITTPNPEIVLKAQNDKLLRRAINSSDISLPDGIGLVQANKFLQMNAPSNFLLRVPVLLSQLLILDLSLLFHKSYLTNELNIIKGREMFMDLVHLANKKGFKIYLLGGEGRVPCQAADEIKKNYKKVEVKCAPGPLLNKKAVPVGSEQSKIEEDIIKEINEFKPDLLFVGFGAPKQERWLYKWLENLDVGGAMTVGGAFDYLAGSLRLPPKWVADMGFEWLWRLINQPSRIKRIFNAVIVFPWKVFIYKLNSSHIRRDKSV